MKYEINFMRIDYFIVATSVKNTLRAKHVLGSFLTKIVVCSRMCFKPNHSKSFNHTNDRHAKMLIVRSNFSSLNLFMCISCLSLFLETNKQLSQERL